jgi:hypothetical protein
MKNISRFFLFIIISNLGGGCIIMHHVHDVPVNPTTFRNYQETRPYWTIQSDTLDIRDVLVQSLDQEKVVLSVGDVLTQKDHPQRGKHPHYWRTFGKYKLKHFHIHVPRGVVPPKGRMELQYSNIVAARTHSASWLTVPASMLATATGMGIFLLIACNCPQVMVLGPDGGSRAGALFPGAMGKGLERSDNLLLRNVPLLSGNVRIRLFNELPEIEYIDQVALFELSNIAYSSFATLSNVPVAYGQTSQPQAASNGNGLDITTMVSGRDSSHYDFNEIERYDKLNRVYLKFSRSEAGNQPLLIINAKQSRWLETLGEFIFQQVGNKFEEWTEHLDRADPKKYNQDLIEKGISLNAYVKVDGEWKYSGSFENVGTAAFRTMALRLDTDQIEDSEIEVRLESAHGVWELDYAALTNEWSSDVEMSRLRTLSAVDQAGQDATGKLTATDESYVTQPAMSSFVDLAFEAPSHEDATLMLSGTGYYHHERDYAHEPNKKFLREFRRDDIVMHQLSRDLKAQMAPSLSASTGKE